MQALLALIMKGSGGTTSDVPIALPTTIKQQTPVLIEEVKGGSTLVDGMAELDKLESLIESRGDVELLEVLKGHRERFSSQ